MNRLSMTVGELLVSRLDEVRAKQDLRGLHSIMPTCLGRMRADVFPSVPQDGSSSHSDVGREEESAY